MDELIKQIRHCSAVYDCRNCPFDKKHEEKNCIDLLLGKAADAIESLVSENNRLKTENKRQWIPASERLPEPERTVLVIDRVTREITTAQLNDFNSFVFMDGRGHGASHWMPLPDPPKEVQHGQS